MSAQIFWDAAKSIIDITEKHPFLVAMVDGTLGIENFRYYVVQDALYLHDFYDCLLRLGNHPGIPASESKRLHEFAQGAKDAELQLHESFFKEWNISSEGVEQMPNTLLYTSFMYRTVATKPHAEGLAALLPCFWVYMHVGKRMLELRAELGNTVSRPPQFDAWIDMYGGDEFEKEVKDYIAIVDSYCRMADKETLERMQENFILCCTGLPLARMQ
ncbi:hypothetical protein ACA910_009935 [Epithemia clementina (nom. ined.)]